MYKERFKPRYSVDHVCKKIFLHKWTRSDGLLLVEWRSGVSEVAARAIASSLPRENNKQLARGSLKARGEREGARMVRMM